MKGQQVQPGGVALAGAQLQVLYLAVWVHIRPVAVRHQLAQRRRLRK